MLLITKYRVQWKTNKNGLEFTISHFKQPYQSCILMW